MVFTGDGGLAEPLSVGFILLETVSHGTDRWSSSNLKC